MLRHFRQSLCEVDKGLAAVAGVEEEDGKVGMSLRLGRGAVWMWIGRDGRAVGGEVGCAERVGRFVRGGGAEVVREGAGDAAVEVWEGVLEDACRLLDGANVSVRGMNAPVFSYTLTMGMPALALHAATSHASLTSVSNRSVLPPSGGSSRITLRCCGSLVKLLTSF